MKIKNEKGKIPIEVGKYYVLGNGIAWAGCSLRQKKMLSIM